MNNAIDSICENITAIKKSSNDSFSVNIHLCDCMEFMRKYEDVFKSDYAHNSRTFRHTKCASRKRDGTIVFTE